MRSRMVNRQTKPCMFRLWSLRSFSQSSLPAFWRLLRDVATKEGAVCVQKVDYQIPRVSIPSLKQFDKPPAYEPHHQPYSALGQEERAKS